MSGWVSHEAHTALCMVVDIIGLAVRFGVGEFATLRGVYDMKRRLENTWVDDNAELKRARLAGNTRRCNYLQLRFLDVMMDPLMR